MFKSAGVMFLYTDTLLHIGSGSSLSSVDLPVQREKHTDYPSGAGSGLKGAIREWFEKRTTETKVTNDDITVIFGPENNDNTGGGHAGAVSFTDLRLLLFPVKSLKGTYAYITCPFVLNRFLKDLDLCGLRPEDPVTITEPDANQAYITSDTNVIGNGQAAKVVLEDFGFKPVADQIDEELKTLITVNCSPSLPHYNYIRTKITNSLIILNNDNFRDFVKNNTDVRARIKLGAGKSTDTPEGNLFYEENILPDTLFYSLVFFSDPYFPKNKTQPEGAEPQPNVSKIIDHTNVKNAINTINGKVMQIGGDETVGKGLTRIYFYPQQAKITQ